jgi:hypothetical protein
MSEMGHKAPPNFATAAAELASTTDAAAGGLGFGDGPKHYIAERKQAVARLEYKSFSLVNSQIAFS